MSDIRRPVRQHLREPFEPHEIDAVVANVMREIDTPSRNVIQPRYWAAAVAMAAAVGLGVLNWDAPSNVTPGTPELVATQDSSPAPLRLADGTLPAELVAEDAQTATQFAFNDGSKIVANSEVVLKTETNDGRVVRFDIEQGDVIVDVEPGGTRRWQLHTELADIEVLGTQFSVTQEPDTLSVAVERGRVLVSSNYLTPRDRVLGAGESVTVTRPTEDEPAPAEPKKPSTKSWERLAKKKDYDKAYDQLGAQGIQRETKRARTVHELFELADVARLSGHPQDAVEPLEYLVRRFPHDRRAGVASFTLGVIRMTRLGEPGAAAESFERAIQLGVPATLRETAYVRAIEMRVASKDAAKAKALIMKYRKLFPAGHHSEEVQRWAEQLGE